MPVLKGIKVDEFENVTVLVVKGISMRHKKVDDSVHIVISEADKSESETMFQNTETQSICWSDTVHNIDMIIDIPNKESLQQLIDYLEEVKQEHYNESL